jgi:Spy/CpxP family protein refolding chaperone
MKELMGKRIEQRVDRILSLREILTAEQFKKLNQQTEEFKKKRGGRHEESRYRDCGNKPDRRS